tara:strand:- start:9 stop:221 length:213 start_codon:yes stop_codon:yes gene_type:complete
MKIKIDRKRHLLKSVTWRIIASVVSFLIGWSVTGDVSIGITVGVVDVVVKFILYYFHERMWYKSKFGIKK